jgi:hypothetical protein
VLIEFAMNQEIPNTSESQLSFLLTIDISRLYEMNCRRNTASNYLSRFVTFEFSPHCPPELCAAKELPHTAK